MILTANPHFPSDKDNKILLMNTIQLINGNFSQTEAIELLTKMVQVKVAFHESKIDASLNEDDIKMREKRIIQLQNALKEAREALAENGDACSLKAEIMIQ